MFPQSCLSVVPVAQQLPLAGHRSRASASRGKATQTHGMPVPHRAQGCSGADVGSPAHGAVACSSPLGERSRSQRELPVEGPRTEPAARALGSLTHSTGTGQRGTQEPPVPWLAVPGGPERLMAFFQCLL